MFSIVDMVACRLIPHKSRRRGTFVPSVLDGKVEGDVGAERAQGLLIRTKSLMCCRECFMVLRVLDRRYG